MPLPDESERDREAGCGGQGHRPFRDLGAPASCFDSRPLGHVSIEPPEDEPGLREGEEGPKKPGCGLSIL
jgi:hypothetical protein